MSVRLYDSLKEDSLKEEIEEMFDEIQVPVEAREIVIPSLDDIESVTPCDGDDLSSSLMFGR